MAKLDDLSGELLLQIASHLSRCDLLNLSLVSKRLRSGTGAELFREYKAVSANSSFDKLLKLVIERPELARHVKHVQLRNWTALSRLDWRY